MDVGFGFVVRFVFERRANTLCGVGVISKSLFLFLGGLFEFGCCVLGGLDAGFWVFWTILGILDGFGVFWIILG